VCEVLLTPAIGGHWNWFCRKDVLPSSVPRNLVSLLLVLKQDLQYKLTVHLRLNVFNDETKLNSNRARLRGTVESVLWSELFEWDSGRKAALFGVGSF